MCEGARFPPTFSRSLPAIPPGSPWRTMHASEKKKGLIQKILALQKEVCYHFASLRPLAQLVEHDTFNVGVAGSIPARPTIFLFSVIQSFMTGFFYILILPTEPQAFTANHLPNREQIENAKFSVFRCVLNNLAANSLFGKVGGRL